MTGRQEATPTAWEGPYQVALVAAIVEALAVAALLPRGPGSEPVAHVVVTGVRAGALVALGVLLRELGPRAAWPALLAWAGLTVAPQLWAYAADARLGAAPVAVVGATAYGLGAHALARRPARAWVPVALAAGASLAAPPAWSAFHQLLGAGPPWWALAAAAAAAAGWTRDR